VKPYANLMRSIEDPLEPRGFCVVLIKHFLGNYIIVCDVILLKISLFTLELKQ